MKTTISLAAAIAVSLLSGCSAIQQFDQYSSATLPTAETIAKAGGEQRFKDTLYTSSDFKADGAARGFSEYKFATESAPCTVLGDAYKGTLFNNASSFYEVEKGSEKFTFNCRAVERGQSPVMRLFLIGSSADCAARTGNSGEFGHMTPHSQQMDQKCSNYRISGGKPTQVDMVYTQS